MNNLLDIKYLGALIRSTWTWRLIRLAMLGLLLGMIAFGWHQHAIPGVTVRDPLMYTNFTTFSLWVVWMMGMVGVALVFGRSWCTVCPVGWLNGAVSRFGLRRELPEWLGNFVPVTLVLILLQLMVYFLAIHRYPDYSAVMLTWMLILAIGGGLIFRRRSFCLLFCPAGALFGLYARLAPWQLRVKDAAVCTGCHDKPCIAGEPLWRQAALGHFRLHWRTRPEGCPVALIPAQIDDSASCTLCLNCVQTCCNDNVGLGFRGWPADLRKGGLRPSETLFFLVLLGLLTANFSKVYVALRESIFFIPERLAFALGWEATGFYPLAVIWISLIFPFLLLTPGLLVYLIGQIRVTTVAETPSLQPIETTANSSFSGSRIIHLIGRLALPMLPLVLSAHLALALVKLNAKAGYLPLILQDTTGVKSFLAINVMQTLTPPGVLISLDILKWLVVLLLFTGLVLSVLAAWSIADLKKPEDTAFDRPFFMAAMVSVLTLIALYGSTVIEWLFVR